MVSAYLHSAAMAVAVLLSSLTQVASLPSLVPVEPRGDSLKFNFGQEKIRGVNLGGWFVLEPWITPSIFEATPDHVVDEWTFGETLGQTEASKRLQRHWSTWITRDDFNEIASRGLNHVRIPIGYWSILPINGEPYVQGAYAWLGKALDWAQAANIKVMIDLHGAPGSQNGFDNSGQKGTVSWTEGNTVSHTLKTLQKIRDDHASHPAVSSIELLNEPMGPSLDLATLKQFYMDGWGDQKGSHVAVTIHDAFQGVTHWNTFGHDMWALLLDTHHYHAFNDDQLRLAIADHVRSACAFGRQMAANRLPTVAGEWAGAMTDCARWLNGRGVGARYDGTYYVAGQPRSSRIGSCDGKFVGTVDGLGVADRNNIKAFVAAQIQAFEGAAGWIFWAWKTETAPEWHFRNLTRAGLVPQPLNSASGC